MWIDDQILEQAHKALTLKVFVPQSVIVVLGRSNVPEKEVNLELCAKENIPVLKRAGGGGTVVLYPGCCVLSLGMWVKDFFQNDVYFKKINASVLETLAAELPHSKNQDLCQRGFSDLCFGDKKFGGTSLFRSRNYLLYQASLICTPRLDLIDRYLLHPSIEPSYREKRSHFDFLTALNCLSGNLDAETVAEFMQENFLDRLNSKFTTDFIHPIDSQIKSLRDKIERDQHLSGVIF